MFAEAQVGVDPTTLENALLEQINRLQNEIPAEAEMEKAINQTEAHFIFFPRQRFQIKLHKSATTKQSTITNILIPISTTFDLSPAIKFVKLPRSTSLKITAQLDIFQPISPGHGGGFDESAPALHHMRHPAFFQAQGGVER